MSLTSVASREGSGTARLAALATVLLLGACDPARPLITGDLGSPPPSAKGQKNGKGAADLGRLAAANRADPADPAAALAYARALRAKGAKTRALAVLDAAAKARPGHRQLALERGLLTLELGDAAKAETLIRAAHDPKAPQWRVHSALGAALASRGRQKEAQAQFAKALALAPNHPSVLNNLALSYALDGKANEAELLLRKAQPGTEARAEAGKVRQNLALVLALGGKYAEARSVAEAALPAAKARGNVAYVQKLAEARAAAGKAKVAADPAAHKAATGRPGTTADLGGWVTHTR
jgi:Flp pilus assembly protein TadD